MSTAKSQDFSKSYKNKMFISIAGRKRFIKEL